jgi:hypothetical protein
MKPEFDRAYRALADSYRIGQQYWGASLPPMPRPIDARLVDDAISDITKELGLGNRLRSDARFFLLVNLYQMVLLPLFYSEQMPRPWASLERDIRDDIRTILETAGEQSNQREISGHIIVNVLSNVWKDLRVTKLNLWG